jgi:hypothetical protein
MYAIEELSFIETQAGIAQSGKAGIYAAAIQ